MSYHEKTFELSQPWVTPEYFYSVAASPLSSPYLWTLTPTLLGQRDDSAAAGIRRGFVTTLNN
jgi:hypothetical protein